MTNPDYISTTHGMSGHFAVWMRYYDDIQGYDVLQTGIGRYETPAEAIQEGKEWAAEMGVEFR